MIPLVLAVGLGSFGGVTPSSSSAADEETWFVAFDGPLTGESVGPDGDVRALDASGRYVQLSCTRDDCVHIASTDEELLLTAEQPTATATWASAGSVCDGNWRGGGTETISFSGTTLTVEERAVGSGWVECGSDTRQAIHGMNTRAVLEWQSGELCVLTGEPCPDAVADSGGDTPGDSEPATPVGTGSRLSSGDPAAPSVLSTLPTPAEAGTAPAQLVLAVVLTIILVLLVAFPTALFNSALETGADRLATWWALRRGPREAGPDAAQGPPWRGAWWWAALGVLAAAVISAFVDPEFGFNPGSARVLLSLAVAFTVDVAIGWVIVVWVMKRLAPDAAASFVFRPWTLIVVAAAVLFTRLTGFEPGIIFGLVAGVSFAALAGRAAQARVTLVPLGYAFAIALASWALYGALRGSASGFWGTFLLEALASTAMGGMAALPIALFPVRGLAGHAVWAWNRWVWAGCYAVGLLAFFIVLMPMPFSWAGIQSTLWAWIGLYLVYAAFAVALWLVLAKPWDSAEAADTDTEVSDPITEQSR